MSVLLAGDHRKACSRTGLVIEQESTMYRGPLVRASAACYVYYSVPPGWCDAAKAGHSDKNTGSGNSDNYVVLKLGATRATRENLAVESGTHGLPSLL